MEPAEGGRANLIVGVLTAHRHELPMVVAHLVDRFGPLAMVSDWMPFSDTDYYEDEMGGPLFRRALSFKTPVEQGELADIKRWTNTLESDLAVEGKRVVNLDPGLLLPARFLLATAKDFAHRIYLSHGIYADLTLIYKDGGLTPMPWTFPDYRQGPMLDFLSGVRRRCVRGELLSQTDTVLD